MSPSVASSSAATAEPRSAHAEVKPELANGGAFSRESIDSMESAPDVAGAEAPMPAGLGTRASGSGNLTVGVLGVVGENGSGRESPEAEVATAPASVAATDEAARVEGLPPSETEGNGNDAGGGEVGLAGDAGGAADDVAAAIARATADFARLPPRVLGSDKQAGSSDKVAGGSDKLTSSTDKKTSSSDMQTGNGDKPSGSDRQVGGSDKQTGKQAGGSGSGSDKQAGETGEKKGLATRARSAGGGSSSNLMRGTASSSLRLKLTAPSTLEDNGRGEVSAPRTGLRASENASHNAVYMLPMVEAYNLLNVASVAFVGVSSAKLYLVEYDAADRGA